MTRNRKILIGVGVVALILFFYMRNKRNTQAMATKQPAKQPQPPTQGKTSESVSGMANYTDAVDFLEALSKKGYIVRGISDDVRKDFINEYQKDISKANHLKVMEILKKPEDKWTLEEEFFYKDNFINNILKLENQ